MLTKARLGIAVALTTGDVNRLSMRSLFPRFIEAERQHGSLLRAFQKGLGNGAAGGCGEAGDEAWVIVSRTRCSV